MEKSGKEYGPLDLRASKRKAEDANDDVNSRRRRLERTNAENGTETGRHYNCRTRTYSSSDDEGDYQFKEDNVLIDNTNQYIVKEFLGSGSFGQVVRCVNKVTGVNVAIKILKKKAIFIEQGEIEIAILRKLRQENTETYPIVQSFDNFTHEGHSCLVFEMLQQSLRQFIDLHHVDSMDFEIIRVIMKQLLTALSKLKEIGITHTDLKPENIMLVNQSRQPYRLKIIDFGSATTQRNNITMSYLQSLPYRSPEVILGLPFCEAIDMWSLGCILAELHLGELLYPAEFEYDLLRCIVKTHGMPPFHMLEAAAKGNKFFHLLTDGFNYLCAEKSVKHYKLETGREAIICRQYIYESLDELGMAVLVPDDLGEEDRLAEQLDREQFMDLLKMMLSIDQEKRILPEEALQHDFLTMDHLRKQSMSPYIRCSLEAMENL